MQIKTTMNYHCTLNYNGYSKKTNIPSVGEDMEQPELSYVAVGSVKRYNHCGNWLAVSYTPNIPLAIWPSNCIPKYLPKRNKYVYKRGLLYEHCIYNNSQKLETIQMSFNG